MPAKPTTASEPEVDTATILYDAGASQTIPLELTKVVRRDGKRILKKIRLGHTLGPLSDQRYFQLQEEIDKTLNRAKAVTTALYKPKFDLWQDLNETTSGYPEKYDFAANPSDCIKALDALIEVQIPEIELAEFDAETDEIEEDAELVLDELTVVPFRAMFSGALIVNLSHSFKEPSKADHDEFMAIETNAPISTNRLAAAEKRTTAEKLFDLGRRLILDREGYAEGSDTPAWHLAATTRAFFLRELARMGKSLGV